MENYLTQIINYLLTQSWQIAVLAVVIAVASLALKNKSAHVRYLLWLIVLAKCLVPPLLTIPLAVLPERGPTAAFEPVAAHPVEPAVVPAAPVAVVPEVIAVRQTRKLTPRQWLGFGWIVGVAAFLLFALIKALRTNSWLWRQRKPLPAELQSGIGNLFPGLDFKTFPKVWLVDGIGQPFVWGLLRGSIYLPADFVKVDSNEHRRGVFGHELSHILRFDAAVNLLQVIVQAIFWFHPFVWWANKKIRAEREKCCDEMAIARLGAKVKDYSSAIVNTLIAEHESTRPVPSLAVAGPVKNIEERIKTMMRPGKKFYKHPSLIAATVVLLLALLTVPTALVLTARAETKAATEAEEKPAESLHQAVADGDIEQVKSLISKGADVNAKDRYIWTPLHWAVSKGHKGVAELLIAKGADVNAQNEDDCTPLYHAAGWGRVDVAELLISKGANINARTKSGGTALHWAAMRGKKETAELLIDKGADVDAKNEDDWTPLHYAARYGKRNVAELLLANGADVNAKNMDDGETPLDAAAMRISNDVVGLLIAKGATVSTLHSAAYVGELAKVKSLIKEGANVNTKNSEGGTSLHGAAGAGYKKVVAFLIAEGADVNAQHSDGSTPLLYAARGGHRDVAELLIAKGADVNAQRSDGSTPLLYAALGGHRDVVELLIAKGADVNAKNNGGETPLHNAASFGRKDAVDLLLAKGADLNAKQRQGYTPLHWAAWDCQTDVAELLIAKGADVNIKSADSGETPLYLAVTQGHEDVVELLIAKGANVNAKDYKGQTALSLAKEKGHQEIVELLRKHGAKE